jgi:ATP-binding cassette, subfamily B, bacterial
VTDRSPIARGFALVATYAREQPKPLAVAVTGSVVFAAGSVAGAIALGVATELTLSRFFRGDDPRTLLAVTLLIGVMLIRSAGVIARRYYAGMTAHRARADLQRRLVARMVGMSLPRLRRRASGELIANLDADTEAAIEVIHPLPFTIGVISMLVFAVASLALLDVPLMLATISLLPIVLAMSWLSARVMQPATERERAANATVTSAATEIIQGAQLVKTLGREDEETRRFAEIVDEHRGTRVHLATLQLTFDDVFASLPQIAMVLIIAVGTLRIEAGALDASGLVQAVALFSIMAFPIQVIGFFLADLPRSVVGRDRLEKLLSEPDDPHRISRGPARLPSGPLAVDLRGVSVGEAERPMIVDLDLGIGPGEFIAIVGPTGSGKSTIIEAIARLRPLTSGSISLGRIPFDDVADVDLRRRVTVATQHAALFGGTIRTNVDFGRGRSVEEIDAALGRAGADDLDTLLPEGFDTVVGERGVTLSGGQRQRVALARALVGDPGLVMLDDATSAVDPEREEVVLANLAALATTVIQVTHRVAAMQSADRVVLIEDGRVVAIGPHRTLMEVPGYARLVAAYQRNEIVR